VDNCSYAPPLSAEAYSACFLNYKKISSEWRAMGQWLQNKLLPGLPAQTIFSILSVGCGSGDFDLELINLLLRQYSSLQYDAVEPNSSFLEKFQHSLAQQAFSTVDLQLHALPFEAFSSQGGFNLVHFTHSLYYIPDRERAIRQALDLLKKDGLLLIFHQTPWGIHQIQRQFLKRAKGDEHEELSSQDISELLNQLGISYRMETVESFLDVSALHHNQLPMSDDLLSFFLECDARQLNNSFKKEVVDYIESISVIKNGHQILFHPVAVFILQ
jgi:SAM-dependent methyltransferase